MFCTKCGTQLPEDAKFCSNCGNKLAEEFAVVEMPTSFIVEYEGQKIDLDALIQQFSGLLSMSWMITLDKRRKEMYGVKTIIPLLNQYGGEYAQYCFIKEGQMTPDGMEFIGSSGKHYDVMRLIYKAKGKLRAKHIINGYERACGFKDFIPKHKELAFQQAITHTFEKVKESNPEICPICGCSLVSTRKGFSAGKAIVGGALLGGVGIIAGGLGSNKIMTKCPNCGHKKR